jgi:hypothetical protein
MVVWNEICEECKHTCNAIRFQQNFENWTSGNNHVDKLIQDNQLSTHGYFVENMKVLEWIPYDRFYDFKYIAKDRFKAKWIDGSIEKWDYYNDKNANWKRKDQNMIVSLKDLDDPNNITLESINKVYYIYYLFI